MTTAILAEARARVQDPTPLFCCWPGPGGATSRQQGHFATCKSANPAYLRADGSFLGPPRADISNPSSALGYVLDLMATFSYLAGWGEAGSWRP